MRYRKNNRALLLAMCLPIFSGASAIAQDKPSEHQTTSNLKSEAKHEAKKIEGALDHRSSHDQAKAQLAPHSLMILTSLSDALQNVKGLQAHLEAVPSPTSRDSLAHVKIYQSEIDRDLNRAVTHEQVLSKDVQSFGDLAQSSEYKDTSSSLRDVTNAKQKLLSKLNDENYLRNKDQVKNDLTSFEKTLKNAIDRSNKFASAKLKLDTAIG